MAENVSSSDEELQVEDDVDGNATSSHKSKEKDSKKSKEKSKKDKSKKKGLFRKLSKSDSKDESKKAAKSKSRGNAEDVGDKESQGSTTKVAEDSESQSVGSSSVSVKSNEKDENTSTEKPKKKKKSKFGMFKKSKKKDVAHTHDATSTAESDPKAPTADKQNDNNEQKDDTGHVSHATQPHSPSEAESELMHTEQDKVISEDTELEKERTDQEEQSEEHHVVSMVIQVVPRHSTSDAAGEEDKNEISSEVPESSPSSKPTLVKISEMAAHDVTIQGETPVGVQHEGEVAWIPPLDDHEVKTEVFTPSDKKPDSENLEDKEELSDEERHDCLSNSAKRPEIVTEEVTSQKVIVVEQQPGHETPEERPSDDHHDMVEMLGGIKHEEEGVFDEQVTEENPAGDAVTLTEPLQDVHSEFPAKEREEKEDIKEQEITEKDEEKEIGFAKDSTLNPDEKHEEQEHPGIKVEMSKNNDEMTAENPEVTEEHEHNKKGSEMPVVSSGKDVDANNYLSLGSEGDSSETDKSHAVHKRKTNSGAEPTKSNEKSDLETSVKVTKRHALFSLRNWCCTIL